LAPLTPLCKRHRRGSAARSTLGGFNLRLVRASQTFLSAVTDNPITTRYIETVSRGTGNPALLVHLTTIGVAGCFFVARRASQTFVHHELETQKMARRNCLLQRALSKTDLS
jgi:hypothetical protein